MSRRDDDFTDEPPRRRRDDDFDDEDRPRRRRRREDEDDDDDDRFRRRGSRQLTGMDGMFANTNIVALILFGLCCGDIALILGIVGLAVCQDERARQNALIVTCISAVRVGVTVTLILTGVWRPFG